MRVTDSTPCLVKAKQLPAEIWLEAVQYLTPGDFLSFSQTCSDFWELSHASASMAHVLRQCPLTLDEDPETTKSSAGMAIWPTVQQRAKLHQRLQKGPLYIQEETGTHLSGGAFSPGYRHFMYNAVKDHQRAIHIVHLDDGNRPVTKVAVTCGTWTFDFLADGHSLLVWREEHGPVELMDLRSNPPVSTAIAPRAESAYRGYITNSFGSQFTFSCSDQTLRTYVRDQNELFREDKVVQFGADVDIQHMTADQRGIIALANDDCNLHLYARRSDETYDVTDIGADCCAAVIVSPQDKFLYLTTGCAGYTGCDNFYAMNLDAEQPLRGMSVGSLRDVYYNSDETLVAVTHSDTFKLFTWPNLAQISDDAVNQTQAPVWLRQLRARNKRERLRLNYKFWPHAPGVSLFLDEL